MMRYLKFIEHVKTERSLIVFIIAYGLFTQLVFQKPLLEYVVPHSGFPSLQSFSYLLSLQIIYFLLSTMLLFVASLFSVAFLKFFCIITVLLNAVAFYFMTEYGMAFDRSMIGNIVHTDIQEAADLWHISIVPYVFFLGVIPAVIIGKIKLKAFKWYGKILCCCIALLLLGTSIYAFSGTWLWYDQHASQIGRRVLPWSYIINTARYFYKKSMNQREQQLLPDAVFLSEATQKEVVILVIGEAVRADHLAHYGYHRETNPFTKNLRLQVFKMGRACATNTIGSVACIVTHEGSDATPTTSFEPIQSYLTRHTVETIVRRNNSGLPPVTVTHMERAASIMDRCTGETCPKTGDEALNWQLGTMIEQSTSRRLFITLHQKGSHGPRYWQQYPDDFEHFVPVCKTVDLSSCSPEMLINAYDNALRYTDSLLADIIEQLDRLRNVNSVMIYVADHGQSLGENGLYLHGVPMAFAPPEQYQVPFLVWMSEGFQQANGLVDKSIITPETYPHDFVFHSIMGAFGMRSAIYKPEFDIYNTQ